VSPGDAFQATALEVIPRKNESVERMIKRFSKKVRDEEILREFSRKSRFEKTVRRTKKKEVSCEVELQTQSQKIEKKFTKKVPLYLMLDSLI